MPSLTAQQRQTAIDAIIHMEGMDGSKDPYGPTKPGWGGGNSALSYGQFHLQLGLQNLNIPSAYGDFSGGTPAQNPNEDYMVMYYALPGIQPISPTDLSPLLTRGFYHYIRINVSYNDDEMEMHPELTAPSDIFSLFNQETRIADNTILPYETFKEYPDWYFGGVDELFYSADPRTTFSTFPPSFFHCNLFAPGVDAFCEFDAILGLTPKIASKPNAGIDVNYVFSRDYFSQIPAINRCLKDFFTSIMSTH